VRTGGPVGNANASVIYRMTTMIAVRMAAVGRLVRYSGQVTEQTIGGAGTSVDSESRRQCRQCGRRLHPWWPGDVGLCIAMRSLRPSGGSQTGRAAEIIARRVCVELSAHAIALEAVVCPCAAWLLRARRVRRTHQGKARLPRDAALPHVASMPTECDAAPRRHR
jgi:hypothetical protein